MKMDFLIRSCRRKTTRFLTSHSYRFMATQVKLKESKDHKKAKGKRPFRVRVDPKNPQVMWESVIGLEIHAQIAAKSKLFSSAPGQDWLSRNPNSAVSFFDAALPGTLPVLNKACVEGAVKTALALNCQLNKVSYFDRKHYFYADLPAGYQITQYRRPIAEKGYIHFPVIRSPLANSQTYWHKVDVTQIQLEQDSGKSIHDEGSDIHEQARTLIDLNRAGVGLMEIVLQPQLFDGEEAAALVKELSLILRAIETCSCKMAEGALRVDANISVRQIPQDFDPYSNDSSLPLGVRTEVKNLNSIRSVAKAIELEVDRQIRVLSAGGEVINETRSYEVGAKETLPMRDKEAKQDYRFMPEPNLPPLHLSDDPKTRSSNRIHISAIKNSLPVLPDQQRSDLMKEFGLSMENACRLVNEPEWLEFFLSCLENNPDSPNIAANLLVLDVINILSVQNLELSKMNLSPKMLVELANIKASNELPHNVTRKALETLMITPGYSSAEELVQEKRWRETCRNLDLINTVTTEVINENPKLWKQVLKGKKDRQLQDMLKIINAKSNNELDMVLVSECLKEKVTKAVQK